MLAWVITTPLGSAVVPEVKTICTASSREDTIGARDRDEGREAKSSKYRVELKDARARPRELTSSLASTCS